MSYENHNGSPIRDRATSTNDGTSSKTTTDYGVRKTVIRQAESYYGVSTRQASSVLTQQVQLTKLATIFTGDEHLDGMINSIAVNRLQEADMIASEVETPDEPTPDEPAPDDDGGEEDDA